MLIAWDRERDGCNIADCRLCSSRVSQRFQPVNASGLATADHLWGLSLFFLMRTSHCHVLEGIDDIMGLCGESLSKSAGDGLIIWHPKAKTQDCIVHLTCSIIALIHAA